MLRMGKRVSPRNLWPDYHPLFWNREEDAGSALL
jgi:hypothetical protein